MFLANYSDGLTDLDLNAMIDEFRQQRQGRRRSWPSRRRRASTSSTSTPRARSRRSGRSTSPTCSSTAASSSSARRSSTTSSPARSSCSSRSPASSRSASSSATATTASGAWTRSRSSSSSPTSTTRAGRRGRSGSTTAYGPSASVMLPLCSAPPDRGRLRAAVPRRAQRRPRDRLRRDDPPAPAGAARSTRITWVVLSGNAAAGRRGPARRAPGARPPSRRPGRCRPTSATASSRTRRRRSRSTSRSSKREVTPDLVFTHYRDDRHQDHRLVSDLTYNTFRDHLDPRVRDHEARRRPREPQRLRRRSTRPTVRRKVKLLDDCFGSQRDKRWFNEDVVPRPDAHPGLEAGAPSGYAEAFYGRKLVL